MERGICGEEDRGTYPAWTFTSPWLPSHLLPQPRLWLTLLRGHLHHLPMVPFCSLLLLATKWWGSCVGGRGVLIATVCEAWQRDRSFEALFIKKKNKQNTNKPNKQNSKKRLPWRLPSPLSSAGGWLVSSPASAALWAYSPLSLISQFLAFRSLHSLSGVLPSNMLLSEILLIACSHYLNEQLQSESVSVIPVLFLLVFEQHEL